MASNMPLQKEGLQVSKSQGIFVMELLWQKIA